MQNLLLLHGALGAAAMFDELKEALQPYFRVYTLNFAGHGGRELPQAPFSMALFAADILHLLDSEQLESVSIFGYSMGGYAALYFASLHPGRVTQVFTLATKFDWSPEAAAKEARMLDPDKMEAKVPAFATALARRHAPQNWKALVHKTSEMMRHLGDQPPLYVEKLAQVQIPVQVAVGDRDAMVSLTETSWAYQQLPEARLLVLPQTRHPLEAVPVQRLAYELIQFLQV